MSAQSGTCGANLTWNLTGGVLTISGTGAMTNYSDSNHAPWYDNRSSITSVTIGNGVTSIGYYAFRSCSSLTTITIPSSVTRIGGYAFNKCSSLTAITIPNSVTSIGNYAFYGCSSLTSITCEAATPPTCGDDAFDNVPKTIPVYVPAASVAAYKAADGWKDFGDNIQAIHATAVDQISNNQSQMTNKIIKDNQIFILLGEKVYTVTGKEVK